MSLGFGKWSHLEAILPPEMLTLVDENQVVKPLLAAVSFVAVLGGIYLWAVPNSITVCFSFLFSSLLFFSFSLCANMSSDAMWPGSEKTKAAPRTQGVAVDWEHARPRRLR